MPSQSLITYGTDLGRRKGQVVTQEIQKWRQKERSHKLILKTHGLISSPPTFTRESSHSGCPLPLPPPLCPLQEAEKEAYSLGSKALTSTCSALYSKQLQITGPTRPPSKVWNYLWGPNAETLQCDQLTPSLSSKHPPLTHLFPTTFFILREACLQLHRKRRRQHMNS